MFTNKGVKMQVISEGFTLNYEVLQIGTIKPGAAGSYNGNPYKASVKFRSTLAYSVDNDKVGVQEKEDTIEFRIPCASDTEATVVSEHIRKARANGQVIIIDGALARKSEGSDIFTVTSRKNGADFIKSMSQVKK